MKHLVLSLIATLALLTPQVGFADKTLPMQTSHLVPGAEGEAVLSHDRNGNAEIKLSVHHLAKPESLSPAKNVYIVWVQPSGEKPINAGVLRVNDELKGEFKTGTPYKKFDVFVTAEDSPTVTEPSGTEIMRQQFQDKS